MILSDIVDINKKIYTYWDDEVPTNHDIYTLLASYRQIHPDYEIGIIDKKEIKHFLNKQFPFLYDFFDKFNIYTVRSDISRMAHLYMYGGFYCDSHIQLLNRLENLKVCDNTTANHKSFIATKQCGTHLNNVSLQYSIGQDNLQLQCLKIAETRLKEIINNQQYQAGQYEHHIHVACSNGMYAYIDINNNIINPHINQNYLFNFFGHISPNGGDPNIFKPYSSIMMTSSLTRAHNKHWSILCKEIDLI